ncbi:transglutaminase-like cysteine peptidase [Devosia beringensis]|uniref:transglutaminase-like cysteine peptidase n=1 Tax=Devosia beringensis TaxID=2657486 RepID=UPI00186B850A|nr:transglutaminase-like cysteine peptidase [Devosia beringensis]
MQRILTFLAVLTLLFPATLPSYGSVGRLGATRMVLEGSFDAPLGYQLFCLTNPRHCRGGGASEVNYTDRLGEMLQRVNSTINGVIRPRNEAKDVWSIGVSQGDCEEYALAKRAELVRLGLPASAVRIAMAKTRSGQGHAVVVVRTNAGDLVLDNLRAQVSNWDETDLRWVAMASSNGRAWQHIL